MPKAPRGKNIDKNQPLRPFSPTETSVPRGLWTVTIVVLNPTRVLTEPCDNPVSL